VPAGRACYPREGFAPPRNGTLGRLDPRPDLQIAEAFIATRQEYAHELELEFKPQRTPETR
jgi:hypothetical protein